MKIRTLAAFLAMTASTVVATLYITGMGRMAHADAPAKAGPIYAQLSSMTTQLPKDGNPLIVQMENNDALSGLTHDPKAKPGEIKIDTDGVYFVVAAIQVGKEKGDTEDSVDVWIKQNGKDVDNSGCRQAVPDPKYTTVLVSQGIAECKAGDILNVAISASARTRVSASSPRRRRARRPSRASSCRCTRSTKEEKHFSGVRPRPVSVLCGRGPSPVFRCSPGGWSPCETARGRLRQAPGRCPLFFHLQRSRDGPQNRLRFWQFQVVRLPVQQQRARAAVEAARPGGVR